MKFAKILVSVGVLFLAIASSVRAQDRPAMQQKLTSQYALTKTTADKSDIVTAGAILVLKKDNLVMVDVNSANIYQNTYKDGKITQNALGRISRFHMPGLPAAPSSGAAQRTFVAGEKMWVTGIEVKENGVQMLLYTDAINDVRYGASLFFPIKSSQPIDQAEKMVAEVFDVQPSDDSGGSGQQQAGASDNAQPAAASEQTQPATAAAAPPPPIAPPPPPADEPAPAPKTISLGQTEDVVVANLGKPDKIAKLGKKEIYYYKDLKVTFVSGKVTDVE